MRLLGSKRFVVLFVDVGANYIFSREHLRSKSAIFKAKTRLMHTRQRVVSLTFDVSSLPAAARSCRTPAQKNKNKG
jgi:hypothetical protein